MKKHSLILTGEINEDMVSKTIKYFNANEPMDNKYFIYLTTGGGEVDSAFAIYDTFQHIKSLGHKIVMVCAGSCCSAGTLLMCGASIVKSLPNTQFLIHYGLEVNTTDDEKKQNEEMGKRYINIMDKKLLVNIRTLKGWMKREKYFMPEQAKKIGLIDGIIGKKG